MKGFENTSVTWDIRASPLPAALQLLEAARSAPATLAEPSWVNFTTIPAERFESGVLRAT